MAGNLREWCWNASAQGRSLRGGAWNDQTYMFGNVTQAPALDRSETNGFRCVRYIEGKTPPEKLFAAYRSDAVRDFAKEKPVSDEVFAVYRRLFDYDARDLQARVEARDETRPDWIRERVSFTAAYGDERVIAQLFLPRTGQPALPDRRLFPRLRCDPGGAVGQRRRKAFVRALHLSPSQVGPRSALPRLQGYARAKRREAGLLLRVPRLRCPHAGVCGLPGDARKGRATIARLPRLSFRDRQAEVGLSGVQLGRFRRSPRPRRRAAFRHG